MVNVNVDENKTEIETKISTAIGHEQTEFNHFYQQGLAKYEKQNYQSALAEFDRAIKIDPRHADAYIHRGDVKDKLENYEGAIADYNEAIKIDSTHPKAYYRRGNVLRKAGDNWGAIADYNQAIRLNPNYTSAKHRSQIHANPENIEQLLQD
ncbi:MAG: tetratricopeptide repeat protein [Cyanobacteria bacterium P01_H01_bin.35]